MSKSLARVRAALESAGLQVDVLESGDTHSAAAAAAAAGCTVDQIAKSILFAGETSGRLWLFLTAGGSFVDPVRASALAGEPLGRADARQVRAVTGFAIGGVSPIGHLTPVPQFFDNRLLEFASVWCAAGTPRHIFALPPQDLLRITGAQRAEFTSCR